VKSTRREGDYYRVFKPDWADPLDTAPSKQHGGRWNPAGAFGVLYLNATLDVAAANARAQHVGRAIGLFDLRPERRPHLLQVAVPRSECLDVVTPDGIEALRLPPHFPHAVAHARCQKIGRRAYVSKAYQAIACRSAAECGPKDWIGEELAWFDAAPALSENAPRRDFAAWYPDSIP
jgi:RES domain-containing protein